MARYQSALNSPPLFHPTKPVPKAPLALSIRCGPRSNRGPLVKGRILSTEAILAIQSLKRAYTKSPSPSPLSTSHLPDLTRLLKPDLLAIIRELLRQDNCPLALHVLSTLRTEYPDHPPDDLANLYADVIFGLSRNKLYEEIDRLVGELGGIQWGNGEEKGLARIVKGLVEAGRRESTVKVVGMMRSCGCGDTWTVDDYLVDTLSRGLRGLGEPELADQIRREFGQVIRGSFGKSIPKGSVI